MTWICNCGCGKEATHFYYKAGLSKPENNKPHSRNTWCTDYVNKEKPGIKKCDFYLIKGEEEVNQDLLKWAKVQNCWDLAEAAASVVPRVMLWGLPGTAKTSFGLRHAAKKQRPRYSLTFSEDFTTQELLGHFIPKGNVFEWHDGPVTRAWREGATLVLNELGRASGPVLDIMLCMLDDPSMAELALPTGEVIRPKTGFCAIATSNSKPELMDPALVDRFDAIIEITVPHPDLVKHLDDKIAGLGTAVLNSYQDPTRYISPRRALAFIQLIEGGVGKKTAALLAFGERAQDFVNAAGAAA